MSAKSAWITTNPALVVPLIEYCDDGAREVVEKWVNARNGKVAASKAAAVEGIFPAPPGNEYRNYQKAGIAFMHERFSCLNADVPRLGKSLPVSEQVLTPRGFVNIGSLKVGDFVVGSNGRPTKVTGVFPQGVLPTFKVHFSDGTTVLCSESHLWEVTDYNNRTRVLSLSEIVSRGLRYNGNKRKPKNRVRINAPVVFDVGPDLPIEPYMLGALLGDGCIGCGHVSISIPDHKLGVLEEIRKYYPYVTGPHVYVDGACPRYNLIRKEGTYTSEIRQKLKALGLTVNGHFKNIPEAYKHASVDARLRLLQGLMDTDGSCIDNRSVFHTVSPVLAEDVAFLVRSLGGTARVNSYDRTRFGKGVDYQVSMTLPCNPFLRTYKKNNWAPPARTQYKNIVNVTSAGSDEHVCISVDAPDSLYITNGFTLTHNTIMTLGVVNKYDKPLRVLVVCPAVAKPVWQEEAEKWLIHNDGVAYAEGNTFPNTSFVIINYDILVRNIYTIKKREWDIIVADEAHYLKNPKSGRSEAFFSIPYPKLHYMFLTGTPILRTPVDLWPLIKVLDPQKLGSNFWRYVERYCGASKENKWDTTGAANTEELQYRMRRDFMIRREKKDVGSELPPFSQCVLLPSSGLLEKLPEEEEYKDTDEANNRIRALIEDIMGSNDSVATKTARLDDAYGEITHDTAGTREQLARRKVPMVVDFCKDLLNSEDKIVVFAFHRRAVESIAEGLSDYNPITIYGGQTTQKRWEAIQQFKKDPATRVAVVNIRSGGTAISLKEADIAVFAEITTPGEVIQARDRVWDLTKDVSVGYYYLVVDNSPEVGTWELFKARQTIVDKATNHEHITSQV